MEEQKTPKIGYSKSRLSKSHGGTERRFGFLLGPGTGNFSGAFAAVKLREAIFL